ncbi:MAG: histidinol dehydrogenase [Phycisphaeraceae bacterium]|nr:histidinol dehydrogenase [Phycisphaeraceae bacterium]
MLPILQINNEMDRRRIDQLIGRLGDQAGGDSQLAEQVAKIVEDVRTEGDQALVRYMRRWTDPDFREDGIRVEAESLAAAEKKLDASVKQSLQRSIDHVRAYQQHVMPTDPPPISIDGAELSMRFTPIRRAGLHVPGGRAAYPSSVIMLAVPAQVAGVQELSVVCPPPTGGGGDVSDLVLGVCSMLKIQNVFRIGGAQAIAALAFGTETVRPVDLIAGPGNAYTQQAKRQLFGTVGIDGFFGPSEVVVLVDGSADPRWVAADLLAQAEHDPGCCFLIATDLKAIEQVAEAAREQLPNRKRREAIESALRDFSAAILVDSDRQANELVDRFAAEHVTLAVADPKQRLEQLSNGGAWFLGDATPVASGDYYAGPSHCLPTGTTARFSSGLSVYTFLKRSSVETYPEGLDDRSIEDIAAIAEAEGLDAHAHSVRIRGAKSPK